MYGWMECRMIHQNWRYRKFLLQSLRKGKGTKWFLKWCCRLHQSRFERSHTRWKAVYDIYLRPCVYWKLVTENVGHVHNPFHSTIPKFDFLRKFQRFIKISNWISFRFHRDIKILTKFCGSQKSRKRRWKKKMSMIQHEHFDEILSEFRR